MDIDIRRYGFVRLSGSRAVRRVMLAALAVGLSGCGSFGRATQGMANMLTLYRPEVVQGNFVSKEQVALLQPGMTRLLVRDTLGTPLMTSVFHGDRWDYVFTMKRRGVEAQSYRLTLFFKGDALDRFEGDDMPSETEFVERISREREVKVPELEATEEQLAKFSSASESDAAQPAASAPAQPSGNYPPLEQ
jgi:outer membrane protein assembly factor BamE